jgi:hypothetical protein
MGRAFQPSSFRRFAARISVERAGSAAATARESTNAPIISLSICSARSRRAEGRSPAVVLAREVGGEDADDLVDLLCESSLHLRAFPGGVRRERCRGRLPGQLILGREMVVEAAVREARGLHEVRDADAVEPALAKERRILG